MSDTLLGKQNQFVTDYLNQCRIIDAPIPGIGNKLKARLRSAGIHTAADVTYYKVTSIGVGQSKIHSLAKWRNSLITHAKTKRNMPTSLSRSEIDGIKRKYEAQKRQFENQKNDIQQRLAAEETAILDLYATKRRPLDDEQFTAQNISDQESSSIRNRYAQECASISEWLTQLATESQQIDDDISKLQKQIFDCNWRIAKIRHDIAPYKELTFRNYIYLLLFGHNSKLD
jgi:hypothetical protein